jgi:hypothetical protein
MKKLELSEEVHMGKLYFYIIARCQQCRIVLASKCTYL